MVSLVWSTAGVAAATSAREPSECLGLYHTSRSGSNVRVYAFSWDLKPVLGTHYGTTDIWAGNTYKGGFNTSPYTQFDKTFSTGSSTKVTIKVQLIDDTGSEKCTGYYYT